MERCNYDEEHCGGRLRAGILVLAKLLTHKISVRPFLPYLNTIKLMHVRDVFWAQQIKDAARQLKNGWYSLNQITLLKPSFACSGKKLGKQISKHFNSKKCRLFNFIDHFCFHFSCPLTQIFYQKNVFLSFTFTAKIKIKSICDKTLPELYQDHWKSTNQKHSGQLSE